MTTLDFSRWRAASPLLDHALQLGSAELEAWLAQLACESPQAADDVRALLALRARGGFAQFMTGNAALGGIAAPAATGAQAVGKDLKGTRLGPYVLEEEIGRGGMGSVWAASRADGRYQGRVAIKFLSALALGAQGSERFRREGAVLARLDHPHIARLIDAGVVEPAQPYLVLEFVEGERIDVYCDRLRLELRARLQLFLEVIAAVAHAHRHLVVHRDIKPGNILVTAAGTVKLLDFGVAKLMGGDSADDGLTREAGAAFTPEFAAPEQLLGEPVTTATDVYSLGVLLYLLLTGRLPDDGAGRRIAVVGSTPGGRETRPASRAVREGEADGTGGDRFSAARGAATREQLERVLRGDLDNIIAKALKHTPAERYASANALGEDLRCYLDNRPVSAQPDTVGYRTRKFVRRHRGAVGAAALTALLLIVATIVTTSQLLETRRQRDLARRELQRAEAFGDLVSIVFGQSAAAPESLTPQNLLAHGEKLVKTQFAETPLLRSQLLHALAQLHAHAGLTGKQRELYAASLEAARLADDPEMIARAGCALTTAVASAGQMEGAAERLDAFLTALPAGTAHDDARAQCLGSASRLAIDAGDGEKALVYAEQAHRLQARNDTRTRWSALSGLIMLADAQRNAGRYAAADRTYAEIDHQLGDLGLEQTNFASVLQNNWAVGLLALGQPRRASELMRQVVQVREANVPADALSRTVLAQALLQLARAREAGQTLAPAMANALANGNRNSANMVRMGLVNVQRELGNLEESSQLLDEAEREAHAMLPEGHEAFGAVHLNRAHLARAQGDLPRAVAAANAALAIYGAKPGLAHREASTRRLRAELLLAMGRPLEALEDVQRALAKQRELLQFADVRSYHVGMSLLALARIQVALGDAPAAAAAARDSVMHLADSASTDHPATIEAREIAGAEPDR